MQQFFHIIHSTYLYLEGKLNFKCLIYCVKETKTTAQLKSTCELPPLILFHLRWSLVRTIEAYFLEQIISS